MVNDQHIEEKISWSDNGESFIVLDIYEFSEVILPKYFKHNKWSSFVRQLNTYGFCKVTDYKNDNDKQTSEFTHPLFYRNGHHALHKIRRNMRTGSLESISPQYNNNSHNSSISLVNQFTPLLMVHTTASTAIATETTIHNNENTNKNNGSGDLPLAYSLTNINDNLHNLIGLDNQDETIISKCLIACGRIENLQNDIERLQAEIISLKKIIHKQQKVIEKLLNHILNRVDGTPQSRNDAIKKITAYLEWIQKHELFDIVTVSKNDLHLKHKEYNIGTFNNHTTRVKLMDIDESEVDLKINQNNDAKRDSTINNQEKSLMQAASPKFNKQ
ncbi:unnamed protein product [Cunninghamella echinulata]